jgi:predicted DNA-binding antitoxin AbrB/MazE fold protein
MRSERCDRIRVDRLLVERGLADTREKAQALILAGQVLVDEQMHDCASCELIVELIRRVTMTQITEAIFTHGVLKPAADLNLREEQRVRVIVEPIDDGLADRDAAVARLKAGIRSMQFFSKGPLPTRDDIHDRA